jgi:broad specificity phosphatase PhoE
MIAQRLEPFFALMEERASQNPQQALLVVTHAVTLRLIRATLEKTLPLYPSEIARNGEIWEVDFIKAQSKYELTIYLMGEAGKRVSKA